MSTLSRSDQGAPVPTNLDRIQVLLQPEPFAKVKTLAKQERLTLSAMAAKLVCAALELPQYREALDRAEEEGAAVPVKADPRSVVRQPQMRKAERKGPTYEELLEDPAKLEKALKILELLSEP